MAPSGPVDLNKGNQVAVTVQFAPTSPGSKSCVIDIQRGTTTTPVCTAIGTAQAPAIQIDQSPTSDLSQEASVSEHPDESRGVPA